MTEIIKHQGIVENISDTHISVRIVQTSACAACSAKGHCSSADSKEKIIDVHDSSGGYHIGDQVMIVGETFMGMFAVWLAFVIPFLLLVTSLFLWMAWFDDELYSALLALLTLVPYYVVLGMNKKSLKRKFSFRIETI